MCEEARSLMEEYGAALSMAAASETSISERRVRTAIGRLAIHNRVHRCCPTLRFERSALDLKWSFRLVSPDR